ncbi:MAG: CCA tRNA nucleotidyltransferase [Candidatus Obscuribacterales bacterium]|jgi:poly(A) polymerase
MPIRPSDPELGAPSFKELGNAYVEAGKQASGKLVAEALTSVKENLVAPAVNAGLIEPANTVIGGVNAVSQRQLIGKFEHMQVANAEFLSGGWLVQTVSGGIGSLVPYVIAGKAAGSALRATGSHLAVEGLAAKAMQSSATASVVGAFAYDTVREVRPGESRLGNGLAGAAGFGVFEAGNMLASHSGLAGRLLARTATGFVGGGVQTLTSTAIAEGRLADAETLTKAAVGGMVMNHALPLGQRAITHAADHVNLAVGRGVPVDRLVANNFSAAEQSSATFKNVVSENPWARVQTDAPQSLAIGNRRIELKSGADAAELGHELKHLSQHKSPLQLEQTFKAAAENLQEGNRDAAWQKYREARLSHEVDARSTEGAIRGELSTASGRPLMSPETLATLVPNLKVGNLTYEQHWALEFKQFEQSKGQFRPNRDFHNHDDLGPGPHPDHTAKSDHAEHAEHKQGELSPEAESAYQRELGTHLVKTLQDKQHIGVFAGGAVRDLLMRKTPKDYDIATSATPDQVEKLFLDQGYKVIPVGKAFGVINVVVNGREFEIATLRSESTYSDGRRPDGVQFVSSLSADAARRDLTINAMFQDPVTGQIYDFYGGQHDLARKVIRSVGDPVERFSEDRLRMLRVPRFASKYEGFTVDPATMAALKANSFGIHAVSNERVRDEIKGMLTSSNPVRGMQIMMDSGLMKEVLPEVYKLKGPKGRQDPVWHPEGTVWTHTKLVLKNLTGGNFERMMGGLLHDVGKPATQKMWPDGGISNHGHDAKGAEITQDIARRLKLSTNQQERISELVRLHMAMHEVTVMRPGKLTAILERADVMDLIEIQHADATGTRRPDVDLSHKEFLLRKLEELKEAGKLGEKPIVNGHMLLAMNIKPGPHFKAIIEAARDAQREGDFTNQEGAQRWLDENSEKIAEAQRVPAH